jgi:hypothetical protein
MSYVAEWRGGGPHDLLRGFDSFRNCFEIVFMATMVRPKAGWCFYTALFFYGLPMPGIGATPAIGVTPDMGAFPDSRTPFGIGSVLFIRLTGIRCTRDASAVTQTMWSGCMIRTEGPVLTVKMIGDTRSNPRTLFIGDGRVSRRNCPYTPRVPAISPKKRHKMAFIRMFSGKMRRPCSLHTKRTVSYLNFLKALIRPLVEES